MFHFNIPCTLLLKQINALFLICDLDMMNARALISEGESKVSNPMLKVVNRAETKQQLS